MKRITILKAATLGTIARDLEDNMTSLRDVLANLEDADVRGEDRDDDSDEVESLFDDLCSNVRAFASAMRVPQPDLNKED